MDETAILTYLEWDNRYLNEKPFQIFSAVDKSIPTSNLEFKDGPEETIHDVRGQEQQCTLDTNGFAFCQHNGKDDWFLNSANVASLYLPEMEVLLRQQLKDAQKIVFFDWRIRKNIEVEGGIIDANDRMQHFLPARHVHIDQTPASVLGRTLLHLPDDAEQLLQGRVRIINMWRPLCSVVEDRPLAVCDLRTVAPDDLVEADHVRKHYQGTNYFLMHSPNYRWSYLSRQTRDEVTLLQMFDSTKEGVSGCPHTSFEATRISSNASKRESIEVRALVFSDAQTT